MVKALEEIQFDKKREYEWLVISQSYFQCALMNARILKEKLSNYAISVDSQSDFCLKKIYGDYLQSCEYLVFPIIFNFKHGIEIYLKAIAGIQNNKFTKNHDLLDLLEKAKIENEKIKCIVNKYGFGHLFLPLNKEFDKENQFERYPQGNPYDKLDLFSAVDGKTKKTKEQPQIKSLEGYIEWMDENNIKIVAIITQAKIIELINDIEFMSKNIRNISLSILKQS
jgi:hypothetical protein